MPVAQSGLYSAKVHEGQLFQAHHLWYARPVSTFNKPVNVNINVTLKSVLVTIVVVEKEYIFAIPSVCVSVALLIHHAMRMRRIIMSSVACLNLPYFFPTISHKRNDFREKLLKHKMCFRFL